MMSVERAVAPWPYAIVHLENKLSGLRVDAPAALVFDTPDGFAFLEPGYLDPYNAENRLHRIVCRVGSVNDGDAEPLELTFAGPEWEGHLRRYVGGEPALDRYAALLLEERGRTVAEEHAHQRTRLAEDLA